MYSLLRPALRLGDLREGRCVYGFFYNQVACCSGLDRNELFLFLSGYFLNEFNSW